MTQNNEKKITIEDLIKIVVEIGEKHKELAESHKRTEASLKKELAESHKRTEASLKASLNGLAESHKITEASLKASIDKLIKSQKNMNDNLGGIGRSNGDMAEEWFFTAIEKSKTIGPYHFDIIDRNMKRSLTINGKDIKGEYDIILINSKTILSFRSSIKSHTMMLKNFIINNSLLF